MEWCYYVERFLCRSPWACCSHLALLLPLACRSYLGILLPPGIAAPLQEGLQLGQSASMQVAPAHHHFHLKKNYNTTTTTFQKR
jgi:hypothetical protein